MQETILQKEITQEKAAQERKTSEAIGNIRTAMLLFLIDIHILGFDIIPDFVGWMSMLGAVELLTGKVKGIERIRTFGRVMLGYELAMVVLNYIGGMLPFYDLIMGYVGIFILCIRMYFMYIILTAAAEVGMVEGGEEKTIQGICRSRSLVLLAELTLHLYAAVQGTEKIGGWGYLPLACYVIFYIGCIGYLSYLKEETEIWEKEQTEQTQQIQQTAEQTENA